MAELNGDFVASVPIEKLKENPFAKELFADLKGEDYKMLKKDIEKNGIRLPLEVSEDFMLIDGHQRLKIARELAMTHVPCLIKKLSEFDAKVWVITANLARRQLKPEERAIPIAKLSELYEIGRGGDRTKDAESAPLKDVLEKTSEVTGYSKRTIADYRAYAKAIEETPRLKGFPIISVLNEVKRQEQIKKRKEKVVNKSIENLFLGDAIVNLENIQNDIVDCVIIDPPYGADNIAGRRQTYAIRGENWNVAMDSDMIWPYLDTLFEKLKPKLKNNAHIYVFTMWQKWHVLYPIISKYFKVINCLIWKKSYPSIGELQGYNYRFTYDMILLASAGENRHLNWQGPKPLNIIETDGSRAFSGKKEHPMEKPTNLLKVLIQFSTVEDEVILDCFAGSGSTLVAAKELKRKWIGIEVDPQWYELAKSRLLTGGENQ